MEPRLLIERLNRTVMRHDTGKFVTLFFGELDCDTGQLRYVNAGHVYPRLRRADGSNLLLTEGDVVDEGDDVEIRAVISGGA